MSLRSLVPLCGLSLLLFFAGCDEPIREVEPAAEETSQSAVKAKPIVSKPVPAPADATSDSEASTPTDPFATEREALIAAWKENTARYQRLKVVMQVEYIAPPVYEGDKSEAELNEEHADLQPYDYTIKEWQQSLWVNGDQFRLEREITQIPQQEVWPATQWTYDGQRELHTLLLPADESAPQGEVSARSPEEVDGYWPIELEPLYKLIRNADAADQRDFWEKLKVVRKEEYQGEQCLVVTAGDPAADGLEYTIAPEKEYRIVKFTRHQDGTPQLTAEVTYHESEHGWVPKKWMLTEMKDGEDGPLSVKKRQASVTVSEFTCDFTDDRSNLYALTFPTGAEVTMFGSLNKIVVAAEEAASEESVPDPTDPVDIDSLLGDVVGNGSPGGSGGEGLPATHQPVDKLKAEYNDKPINLNTFCLDKSGNILMSCGGEIHQLVLSEEEKKDLQKEGESATIDSSVESKNSLILVYSPELEFKQAISIPFKATAVTPFDESSLLIGGEGRLARVSYEGEIIQSGSSPQIEDIDTYRENLMAQAKKERAEMGKMIAEALESFESQLEAQKEVKEEDRTRGQQRRITALERQVEMLKQQMELTQESKVDPQLEMMLQMKLRVPALSVTGQDVFVTVPSLEGYGFEVWRTDLELKNPTMIVGDLRGCCGQMDVYARDDKLYVAENGRFRVAAFDRDGEKLTSFGKSDRSSKEGFGSCCNPMNVRCCSNGDILTAESSVGNIKRFSPAGELLANIGHVSVSGGCKNVAIEYDEDRDRYYMMDLPNHTVYVLHPVGSSQALSLNSSPEKETTN
ncbi:MAG: hypothetical protein CMJ46_05240 [Planctomyces sp.]|nr:hypothetical protein [Planctomyces sp.]